MKDKLTSEEIENMLDNILNDHDISASFLFFLLNDYDISASDFIQILQQYINDLDPQGYYG